MSEPPVRRSFNRVLGWSLVVSVLLHALFLLLSPIFIQTEYPPGGVAPVASDQQRSGGLEIINVVPTEGAPDLPLPADRPTVVPVPTPPGAVPTQPGEATGQTPNAPAGDVPTTGEALKPGYRDPRLYVEPPPLPDLNKSDHERYMEHLQARIDAVNDSMALSSRRNQTQSDWSFTDGSGDRWGLSPDGLHLGGVTLPRQLLPLPTATGDSRQIEERRERERQRDEIQNQAADADIRETQRERIEAIRDEQDARRDQEDQN